MVSRNIRELAINSLPENTSGTGKLLVENETTGTWEKADLSSGSGGGGDIDLIGDVIGSGVTDVDVTTTLSDSISRAEGFSFISTANSAILQSAQDCTVESTAGNIILSSANDINQTVSGEFNLIAPITKINNITITGSLIETTDAILKLHSTAGSIDLTAATVLSITSAFAMNLICNNDMFITVNGPLDITAAGTGFKFENNELALTPSGSVRITGLTQTPTLLDEAVSLGYLSSSFKHPFDWAMAEYTSDYVIANSNVVGSQDAILTFDTFYLGPGDLITYSAGVFTLQPTHTYKLTSSLGIAFTTAVLTNLFKCSFAFYNEDTFAYYDSSVQKEGLITAQYSTNLYNNNQTAVAYIEATTAHNISLRLKDILDAGGGSGSSISIPAGSFILVESIPGV